MKKSMTWLFVLLMSVPLYAQKNLIPAAQALAGKGAVEGIGKKLLPKDKVASLYPYSYYNRLPVISGRNRGILDWQKMNTLIQKKATIDLKKRFYATLAEINKEQFVAELFGEPLEPIRSFSPLALRNNELLLKSLNSILDKIIWLYDRPRQGRDELVSFSSGDAIDYLAEQLSNEKMIILGEVYFCRSVQKTVKDLLLTLKTHNPDRRIVLFTEFLDLPIKGNSNKYTPETYFWRPESPVQAVTSEVLNKADYAFEVFESLLKGGVEIYPLEDPVQMNIFHKVNIKTFREDIYRDSFISVMLRKKSWVRVIESKMREIRLTDPDALFVVYAGMGHTSWLSPYSLPKLFSTENPTVVEMVENKVEPLNSLYFVWNKEEPFFNKVQQPTLHQWTGPDVRLLAKNTGFDYLLVLPE